MIDDSARAVDHDPTHPDDTYIRLTREGPPCEVAGQAAPDQRHRDGKENLEGEPDRLEECGGDHEDEDDGEGEDTIDLATLLSSPGPLLPTLETVTRWEEGRLHHSFVDTVAKLGRATELVADVALVLLVLTDDTAHHLPLLEGGEIG